MNTNENAIRKFSRNQPRWMPTTKGETKMDTKTNSLSARRSAMPLSGRRQVTSAYTWLGMGALVIGLVTGVASQARAIPNHPFSATGYASDMVKAYRDCDPGLASDVTQNAFFPRPACPPPALSSPTCLFSTSGKGKVKMRVLPSGDVSYKLKMKKLDLACEGEQLDFVVKYQQTNDDCSGGTACTAVNTELILGSCTVSSGNCTINSRFNTDSTANFGGPAFASGLETSLAMDGCGLFLGNELAFRCGIYIP